MLSSLALDACYSARPPLPEVSPVCDGCHGDLSATGNSAPPPAVTLGAVVGGLGTDDAHQVHLKANRYSRPVPCDSCHLVPEKVDAPNHLDTPLPAEVVFKGLAVARQSSASWDGATCENYCHSSKLPREDSDNRPRWKQFEPGQLGCDGCHGYPPSGGHPSSERCVNCHPKVVDAAGQVIDLDLHLNGKVEVVDLACNSCHGGPQNNAPPADTLGNDSVASRGVGVHQAHVNSSSLHSGYGCATCHVEPSAVESPGHIDSDLPAEVIFGPVVRGDLRTPPARLEPTWDANGLRCSSIYCHNLDGGFVAPLDWTDPPPMVCGSCHGLPPSKTLAGNPHPPAALAACASCHSSVDAAGQIISPETHVNGKVEFAAGACNACHGSPSNAAPPTDTQGNSDISHRGVGLHQVHVNATSRHPAYDCSVCHIKPADANDAGHMDSPLPAEVVFGPLARGDLRAEPAGMTPSWNATELRCASVYCHGLDGGGVSVLSWTNPTPMVCGSCHGLPPAKTLAGDDHEDASLADCADCHPVVNNNGQIIDSTLHANGKVDVQ